MTEPFYTENNQIETNINVVIGLHNKEYYPLVCSHCDKELIEVFVTEPTEKTKVFTTNCPACGDKSFGKKITGKYIFMVKPDFVLLDIEEDEDKVNFKIGEPK